MAQAIAIGAIAGGGILGASANHQLGQAASRMGTMNANQLEIAANQTDEAASTQEGISQLKAKDTKRQARLLQSRVIALAAANGGDTSEKNVNDAIVGIEGEGEYRALMDLYNGSSAGYELRNKARFLRNQATVSRWEGKQARRAGNMAAFGSILSATGQGASTFGNKYNSSLSSGAGSVGSATSPSTGSFSSAAGGSTSNNTTLQVQYPSVR